MWSLLTGRTEKILETINGITLSRGDISKFGDVVHDYSPVHRDIEKARMFGFRDTPVIGVHLAAIGGRFSRDLISVMQAPGEEYFYTSQTVTFRDPVYPGEQIIWNPPRCETEDGIVRFNLIMPSPTEGGGTRVEMVSEFSKSFPQFSQPNPDNLVYSEDIEITPRGNKSYYECLREEREAGVVFSHIVGRSPSVLLSLASKLNELNGTNIGGRNIEMQSASYKEFEIGKARVDVYFVDKKGRGGRNFYLFDCVTSQEGVPVASTRVKTLTNGEFPDVYTLSNQFQGVN